MTIGEFLTQYAGAFFGFLGAALAAGLACVGWFSFLEEWRNW